MTYPDERALENENLVTIKGTVMYLGSKVHIVGQPNLPEWRGDFDDWELRDGDEIIVTVPRWRLTAS